MPKVTNECPSAQFTSPSGVEGVTYVDLQVAVSGPDNPGPVQNFRMPMSLSAEDPDVSFSFGDQSEERILYYNYFILFSSGVCCISFE